MATRYGKATADALGGIVRDHYMIEADRDRTAMERERLDLQQREAEQNRGLRDLQMQGAQLNLNRATRQDEYDQGERAAMTAAINDEANKSLGREERMLRAIDTAAEFAVSNGRGDRAETHYKHGDSLRGRLMARYINQADREYGASGDPSGYFAAYSRLFPDGNTAEYFGKSPEGKHRVLYTTKDGKQKTVEWNDQELQQQIGIIRDPSSTYQAMADMRKEREKFRELKPGEVVGSVSQGVVLRGDPTPDSFKTDKTKNADGDETLHIVDTRRGTSRVAAGGGTTGTDDEGFNRRDLPIHKEIADISAKVPGWSTPNPLGGPPMFTKEGAEKSAVADRLRRYHRSESGAALTPMESVDLVRTGKYREDGLFESNGRIYQAPVVVTKDGRQLRAGQGTDVTDRIRAAKELAASQRGRAEQLQKEREIDDQFEPPAETRQEPAPTRVPVSTTEQRSGSIPPPPEPRSPRNPRYVEWFQQYGKVYRDQSGADRARQNTQFLRDRGYGLDGR